MNYIHCSFFFFFTVSHLFIQTVKKLAESFEYSGAFWTSLLREDLNNNEVLFIYVRTIAAAKQVRDTFFFGVQTLDTNFSSSIYSVKVSKDNIDSKLLIRVHYFLLQPTQPQLMLGVTK